MNTSSSSAATAIQHTKINGHRVSFTPTSQPKLLTPQIITNDLGAQICVMLTVHHQEREDFHVVTYPGLETIGFFNEADLRVVGTIKNYL